MSWPIPTPSEIADQASTDIEEGLRTAPDGSTRTIDARSPRSVLAVIARVIGLALYPVYLFLSWIVRQIFPDTCDDEFLAIHARIWGVDRLGGATATGIVQFVGVAGTVIAAGTRLTLSSAVWTTAVEAEIGSGGTVDTTVTATVAGTIGNQDAGTALSIESPILGLLTQTAAVAAGGIAGGVDVESIESWRQSLIDEIREPAHGGAEVDYGRWLRKALPKAARCKVHKNWIGAGTVGVVFIMREDGVWRAPTTSEIATAVAYLDAAAPVTATVVVLAGVLRDVDVTVSVSPWSTAVDGAVRTAVAAWFASVDMQIAGTLHLSRLRERVSRAAGESWHDLVLPTGSSLIMSALEFPVLRNLVVTEASS